jgi:hypothetical protein
LQRQETAAGRSVRRSSIWLAVFVVHSRRDPLLARGHRRIWAIIRVPKDRGRPFTPRRR